MSSEISTEAGAQKRAAPFEPWQLFTLGGLISAAIVAFFASAQSPPARVFLILTIFAAAAVGVGALRMLLPLTGGATTRERRSTLSERTRAVLEREKALALRSIKELEFDRAMGKVSESDFHEMSARLRARAGRILRQLDAQEASGYREAIEKELARRLGSSQAGAVAPAVVASAPPLACAACATANDRDARFCKGCGARLETT